MQIAETTLRAGSSPALSVEIVDDLAAFRALEQDWRQLETQTTGATFFASYDWCSLCLHVQYATKSFDHRPAIVVVRRGPAAILIWPLAIKSTGGVTLAQDLTEPFGQYSDVLANPSCEIDAALDAAWAKLAGQGIDGLVLRKVRADATIRPWLSRHGAALGEPLLSPAVALDAFPDFSSYRATLASKTRKNLRNYRNRLAREGRLTHTLVTDPAERARLIEQCFIDRAGWLEAGGLSSSAFADPAFTDIVRRLARADGAPQVQVMRLALERADGTVDTISIQWGFEHRGRYYAYMAAKNPAYDAYSPGRLHLEDVIAACAGRGISKVDFLPPAMAYKSNLATETIGVSAFGRPLRLRGRLAITGWHGYVRPAIKKAVLATPPSIRRLFLKTAVR